MICRIDELRDKEVISVSDGARVGYVSDIELDSESARLTSLVVFGRAKLFGLLGREDDFVIPWEDIAIIGDDTILVHFSPIYRKRKKSGVLSNFFELK
ncbi:MAG: YlmC/YmxH family sporulation protein [Oscillospiraceae bacterium]